MSPSEHRTTIFDVAVVGAGPGGLAATATAADAGCTVAMLDLADRIGGQYYRHAADQLHVGNPGAFHRNWSSFVRLRDRLAQHVEEGTVVSLDRHAVWSIDRSELFVVRAVEGERERIGCTVLARSVVVATGAYDRQVPFPGWTLPGVMTVGGAQSLLKGSLVARGDRVVVAGTGPFLLSVANGLMKGGADVVAVVEANHPWGYARRPRAVAGAASKLPEALGYTFGLARRRVPYLVRHAVIAAHGQGRLERLTVARLDAHWRPVAGSERTISCKTLAVGYGFTPQLDLLLPLGCASTTTTDGSLVVVVDDDQQTTVEGVYAAGETTGVGGADLAIVEGSLAGAAVARRFGRAPGMTHRARGKMRARRGRLRRFANALQDVHPIRDGWTSWLDEATLVCRCEDVTFGRLVEAVRDLGAIDARTAKLLARPGMGWCQGRICGDSTATLTAILSGRQPTRQGLERLAHRVIAQPVPLDVLASIPAHVPDAEAVNAPLQG